MVSVFLVASKYHYNEEIGFMWDGYSEMSTVALCILGRR